MSAKNYFHYQLTTSNSSWLRKIVINNFFKQINLSTIIGAVATTLFFSQNVLAQSFRGYCISLPEKKNVAEQAEQILVESETYDEAIVVKRKGHQYTISLDETNSRELILKQEGKKIELDRMTLSPEEGRIGKIVLGQDDWLWIDRPALDYVMKVNFSQTAAYFDPPIKLPELVDRPCNFIISLWQKCRRGQYNYSASLNRVFISGYPKKSWGKQKYIHSEFISGEEEAVPELLEKAVFIADIPQWKGVLFRDITGEALFYDGTTVINISEDFLELNNSENFQDWEIRKTASGRTFLGKFASRTEEDALFLMELTVEPGLKPIYLPEDLKSHWLEVFSFSEDPQATLWILSRRVILSEVDRRIQTLVALPSFSVIQKLKIEELEELKESNDSRITFSVKQQDSSLVTDYLLEEVPADSSNCEVILDLEQPIILKTAE